MVSDAIKRDNSFTRTGGRHTPGGQYIPGILKIRVNGVEHSFAGETTMLQAVELVEALGEDCTDFRARVAHWVASGE